MPFEDITLEKIQAARKEQILTDVTKDLDALDKKDLASFVLQAQQIAPIHRIIEKLVKSEDCKNGQVIRVYEITDVLGQKLGTRKAEWTYYEAGPVDTITLTTLDALDKILSQKTIKHFPDGRQPIAEDLVETKGV